MKFSEVHRSVPRLRHGHLVEGWALTLAFSGLGVLLEGLLAFKAGIYVNADQEARRLMWRLAHAHGTLLGLMHIALAHSFASFPSQWFPGRAGLTSKLMSAASLLVPGGFLVAGLSATSGDPGIAIALVPAGAVALLAAAAITLWGLLSNSHSVVHRTSHPNTTDEDAPQDNTPL